MAVGLALIGIAAFVLSITVAGFLWFERPTASGASFPEWAHPYDSVKLRDEPRCDVGVGWSEPCRTMAFGTDFSYEEAIDILQYQFGAEGWSAQIAPSDYSLHTMSRDQRSCMVFFPEPTSVPDASSGGSNSQEYEVVVGVVIDGCGTR